MLTACVFALVFLTGAADALTIYRIGGSSLPQPELAEGMESVQHGEVKSLKIDADDLAAHLIV